MAKGSDAIKAKKEEFLWQIDDNIKAARLFYTTNSFGLGCFYGGEGANLGDFGICGAFQGNDLTIYGL